MELDYRFEISSPCSKRFKSRSSAALGSGDCAHELDGSGSELNIVTL